jgi:hypothetical protein
MSYIERYLNFLIKKLSPHCHIDDCNVNDDKNICKVKHICKKLSEIYGELE